ncbi:RHS repeat domain-containing protein [Brevundimonas diminuta]
MLSIYVTPRNHATYSWSPNGLRTSVTDANGNKASMAYDGFDRQVRWNFPSLTRLCGQPAEPVRLGGIGRLHL